MTLWRVVALVVVTGVSILVAQQAAPRANSRQTGDRDISTGNQSTRVVIRSLVTGIRVVAIRNEKPDRVRLTFKNESSKPVKVISFFKGGTGPDTLDWDFESLASGSMYDTSFTVSSVNKPGDGAGAVTVSILALLYEDETGEGDQRLLERMRQTNHGRRVQSATILPHLDKLVSAPTERIPEAVTDVKNAILELPTGTSVEPDSMASARRSTQQAIITELDEVHETLLTQGVEAFRLHLASIHDRYMKRAAQSRAAIE